jgi:5-methylcytosine-specific restriction protein B
MAAIRAELATALEQYERPDASASTARAAEERADLLQRFPVDSWPQLRLEHYALGSVEEPLPYCVMMEFRTPYLGSIKGGSARKHIIYRPNAGGWWIAGPLEELEPHEAWERLRSDFAGAIVAAQEGRFDDIAQYTLLEWGPALITKTFAVYAPEHFINIYSNEHLRRFIRMFGGTPEPNAASWVLNRQFKQLIDTTEPFLEWEYDEVLDFLYTHLDPRSNEAILKIAPGEQARMWPDCLADKNIRIGFGEIGDLRSFASDDALVSTVEAAYPDKGPSYCRKLARQLLRFRDLPAGARIVANRGTSEILAVGTVTEEGYRHDDTLPEYHHVVGVDWDTSYAQQLAAPARGWVPTFNNVTPEQWADIAAGREATIETSLEPRPDDTSRAVAVPVPRDVERLVDALERKGQVIVHGPPGTGKTRMALNAALVLTGRGALAGRTGARRSAAIAEMLGSANKDSPIPQVVMTTFHSSLGYEDFVEGYKPVPTEHGGLALARVDGLFLRVCAEASRHPYRTFVLIIDEINRADVARVLGELVTLLELDKRDSVTVRLPVSGNPFSVPGNIRIIGTMNTADRSVAHLDAAVRRRFGFIALSPDPTVLQGAVGPLNLAAFLSELNRRIAATLTRDHQLGHAHLLVDDVPVDSAEALAAAFYQDVLPQLEDYALGEPELLVQLLGSEIIERGEIVTHEPEDLLLVLAKEFAPDESDLGV